MDIRARKALGCFVLLAYVAIYTAAAVTLGGWLLTRIPQWLLPPFYIVAGIAWIAPLRPLFRWMNGQPLT